MKEGMMAVRVEIRKLAAKVIEKQLSAYGLTDADVGAASLEEVAMSASQLLWEAGLLADGEQG